MEINLKYQFGELISLKLDPTTPYLVVSIQINYDGGVAYGCSNHEGEWKWFKDYEMQKFKDEGKIDGFVINLKHDSTSKK